MDSNKSPRPQGQPGSPQSLGVILHQPLNLQNFRKNSVFWQIMNGIPVCLFRKTENAPTWRPRKHFFGPLFLGLKVSFSIQAPVSSASSPCTLNPNQPKSKPPTRCPM